MNWIDALRAPLFVAWQLTRDCDLACLHCCTESAPGRKLANELDAEISTTNPDTLTPEQLRKVAEIEKLARGVKDKMRISLTTTPIFVDSTPTPPFSRR